MAADKGAIDITQGPVIKGWYKILIAREQMCLVRVGSTEMVFQRPINRNA